MKEIASCITAILVAMLIAPVGDALAQNSAGEPGRDGKKPNPLKNCYFGEQHLHTQDSPDAFAMGTRNTLDDAYNFAKGKAIRKSTTGEMVQKKTPYDWCAVTDHAFMMGLLPLTLDPKNTLSQTEIGKLIATGDPKDMDKAFAIFMGTAQDGHAPEGFDSPEVRKSAWIEHKKITNKHNDPGKFTTLIAFEWTSIPFGQNLHRNVFFRDDEGPISVFSTVDSDRAEDLWTYLEVQRDMGHEVFAIPHNSNVSNSIMFASVNSYGAPIDEAWIKRRAANEVAVEIIQCKGQSDAHPALSPSDEFANFEMSFKHMLGTGGVVSKIDHSYVRNGLIDGVGWQEYLGANPHKFGIVAGADAHTAFSDNEEFNYTGVHGVNDDTPEVRLSGAGQTAGEAAMMFGTPGATGVWAPENTREAIFDAIRNKETFGTSGPLIRVRFFGGWGYSSKLTEDSKFVEKAYKGGVPMGGDLPKKPSRAKAPTFAVWALKDPESGNLDRVQIIKGWFKGGYAWEKIYDVAWSDNRTPVGADGKPIEMVRTDGHRTTRVTVTLPVRLPPVGNTVDVKTATYANDIGDSQLSAVWTDPDFDPALHAVYYVRVLEIPTPRWSTYDAAALGVDPPEAVPATIQERAWSSPIWYTPDPSLVKKMDWYPGLRQYLSN